MYLGRYEGVVFTEDEGREGIELLHEVAQALSCSEGDLLDKVRKFLNQLPINQALNDVVQEVIEGKTDASCYPVMLDLAKERLNKK